MPILGPSNAASSLITATTTATKLFSLMDTAGSVTDNAEVGAGANYVKIANEDATNNIRVLFGKTPTTTDGFIVLKGTTEEFKDCDVANMEIISTAATVNCSVLIGTNIR